MIFHFHESLSIMVLEHLTIVLFYLNCLSEMLMRMEFVVIEYFTDKEKYSMIKIMCTFVGL